MQFAIHGCHQGAVTQMGAQCGQSQFTVFPIKRCQQQVVTAAPERACAAGDPRAVDAPRHLGGGLGGLSSLWKTLKLVPRHRRTPIKQILGFR
jgi:hypothetical protein